MNVHLTLEEYECFKYLLNLVKREEKGHHPQIRRNCANMLRRFE